MTNLKCHKELDEMCGDTLGNKLTGETGEERLGAIRGRRSVRWSEDRRELMETEQERKERYCREEARTGREERQCLDRDHGKILGEGRRAKEG